MRKNVRVAVTQQEPEWLDLQASAEKTCRLIEEAAANGAELITFPECWIPGYPIWIWSRPVDIELAQRYIENSLAYGSESLQKICDAAEQHKIAVSLGFSERDGHSLYISQCTIDTAGKIVMQRRKLKATHMERTIFGDAFGRSLLNVSDLPIGKVGALSCWEHIQPFLRHHTMLQREEIHVAAWPPLHPHQGNGLLWGMSAEGCLGQSQIYALESASFVLHTTTVLSPKAIVLMKPIDPLFSVAGGGKSAIIGPDGRVLSAPLASDEEAFIYADLDMDAVVRCRHFLDACGHYIRPDLLWLEVDTLEKEHSVPIWSNASVGNHAPDPWYHNP